MGTGRKFNKNPVTRPKKKAAARKRRVTTQKKRLMEMGMEEETLRTMTTKAIRQSLIRPLKTKAKLEAAKK